MQTRTPTSDPIDVDALVRHARLERSRHITAMLATARRRLRRRRARGAGAPLHPALHPETSQM